MPSKPNMMSIQALMAIIFKLNTSAIKPQMKAPRLKPMFATDKNIPKAKKIVLSIRALFAFALKAFPANKLPRIFVAP